MRTGLIKYNNSILKESLISEISDILKKEINDGINLNDIAIIAPTWYGLYPLASKLREVLPEIKFDAPSISPIKYDPQNIFFLVARILFTRFTYNNKIRKKDAKEIIDILKYDYKVGIQEDVDYLDILYSINSTEIINDDGITTLKNAIEKVFEFLEINFINIELLYETYKLFFEKIDFRINKYKLPYNFESIEKNFRRKEGIVINTIHGVKGEEYDTVIAFDLLTGILPHRNYNRNGNYSKKEKEEADKLLYVLCSRAKRKMFLFAQANKLYRNETNKYEKYNPTINLESIKFEYDAD